LAKLVDAGDLKSLSINLLVGSNPTLGTDKERRFMVKYHLLVCSLMISLIFSFTLTIIFYNIYKSDYGKAIEKAMIRAEKSYEHGFISGLEVGLNATVKNP
jgi:hypothetical protein